MVLRLIRDLPGDRALLPPSSLRSLLLKNLTPASGRQDHTPSPSASSVFVSHAICVHRIPAPNVRDDRDTPLLWRRDSGKKAQFPIFRKRNISAWRTDNPNQLESVRKIRFYAQRIWGLRGPARGAYPAKNDLPDCPTGKSPGGARNKSHELGGPAIGVVKMISPRRTPRLSARW